MLLEFHVSRIKAALQIAAAHTQTANERATVQTAIEAIDAIKFPSGITINGVEVAQDKFYSESMVKEMEQWGCD